MPAVIPAAVKMNYLDSAATTRPCPEAMAALIDACEQGYGNPSSGHTLGAQARAVVELARKRVAAALGCRPAEIIFTAGGTEANNLILLGVPRLKHAVTTALEHPSVRNCFTALRVGGADTVIVKPDREGHILPEAVAQAVRPDTGLVSVCLVCSETGAVQDVTAISRAVKAVNPRCLVHCDAVQGFGLGYSVQALGVDLLTLSGHKINAPKGIGALYCKAGVRLHPLFHGGEQEEGLRPGTESVPLIASLGAAIEAYRPVAAGLKAYALTRLKAAGVVIIPPADAPHIVSFALPGLPGTVLQRMLDDRGICVSTGSACSRGKSSPILAAMNLPPAVREGAVRVSFSHETTREDIEALVAVLADCAARIASK